MRVPANGHWMLLPQLENDKIEDPGNDSIVLEDLSNRRNASGAVFVMGELCHGA